MKRKIKLKRELKEANRTLNRNMFNQIGYAILIGELIKQHPNAAAVFNEAIQTYASFKQLYADLADMLELDLSANK